jgi:hypothetical protein
MAPVKFEENIREKLEQRAITPTVGSWNKLADKLDAYEEKNSNKRYWWLGIAASIVAIIVVYNSFLNTAIVVVEDTPIQIVNEQDSDSGIEFPSKHKETAPTEDIFIVETENSPVLESDHHKKTETQEITEQKRQKTKLANSSQDVNASKMALNTIDKKYVELDNSIIINSEKKYTSVETQVTVSDSENIDNEIESLLSNAQKDFSTQTAINKEKSKVNAKGLLDEVEFDLDESFRDKVFLTLKTGYKKVSTAVVHRND